jgi:hypothetical protein
MFFRRSIFFILFASLLIFGLVALGGRSSFEEGYAEGFAAAQQAPSAESGETTGEAAPPPAQPYRSRHLLSWGFFSIFGILAFFFKFWLILIAVGFFMNMFGFGHFRHWGHHRWHRHGDDDGPYEKGPDDVEPDIQHA